MERTLRWYSPKTASGSLILAIAAHAALYGAGLLFINLAALRTHVEVADTSEEIAYETFSAPPAPAPMPKPVAKTPEPVTPEEDEKPEPDTRPHELQDSQSTVAGTQAAKTVATTTGAVGQGDAANTPYYKIKPKYPRAALVSGVEGWILLKIDVTETGDVENVRVVGGEQRSMFQDEARRAVEKWKYKPFVDASGKPMKKTDHEVRVDFKLTDAA